MKQEMGLPVGNRKERPGEAGRELGEARRARRRPAVSQRLQAALHSLGTPGRENPLPLRFVRRLAWAGFLSCQVVQNPSTEGHRLRALGRFVMWEVWRRTIRRPVDVMISPDARLRLPPWSTLGGVTVATGHHEIEEELFVSSYVRPGEVVIDAGANIGVYSILCGAMGAHVAAIEPSSRAVDALRRNVVLNRLDDVVHVFPVAVGRADANGAVSTGLDAANRLEVPGSSSEQEPVSVRALDSLLAQAGPWAQGRRITLLKVDCEGRDEEVLEGATQTIARHRPVIMVETWAGGAGIRRRLAAHGYRTYRFDHRQARLIEYPATWAGQANLLAVADDLFEDVERRITDRPAPQPALAKVRWRT